MLRLVKSKRCRAISRVVHLGGVTITPFVATEIPGNSTRNDEEPGRASGRSPLAKVRLEWPVSRLHGYFPGR